jgi:hypothetical protein
MIQIPPGLTETQARVYESYALWYKSYFSNSPLLADQKQEALEKHLEVATAFRDNLNEQIGLPSAGT